MKSSNNRNLKRTNRRSKKTSTLEIQDSVPQRHEMVKATLASLRERGGVATNREIEIDIVSKMNLAEEVAEMLHGEGPMTEVGYRAAWTRTALHKIGAIKPFAGAGTRRGVWTLTTKGWDEKWSEQNAEDECREFHPRSGRNADARSRQSEIDDGEVITEESSNPLENTETSLGVLEESWKSALMKVLLELDPLAFERLCRHLLMATGIDEVEVTPGSHDGGIDGTGQLRIGLVSFRVAFQAKRWKGTVGPDVVQKMQGAMTSDVDRGFVITTGHFSPAAQRQARTPGARPVELVDGERLCDLLVEHELGVRSMVQVDREWFENL